MSASNLEMLLFLKANSSLSGRCCESFGKKQQKSINLFKFFQIPLFLENFHLNRVFCIFK